MISQVLSAASANPLSGLPDLGGGGGGGVGGGGRLIHGMRLTPHYCIIKMCQYTSFLPSFLLII